jgi:hypothetical protein
MALRSPSADAQGPAFDKKTGFGCETFPDQLFGSPKPILFDEWQDTPDTWNLVRRAVLPPSS